MKTSIPASDQLSELKPQIERSPFLVACLCAAWCDTCKNYRTTFDALRTKHPEKCFVWIDIEDQASLLDDLDIENFPSLLIQYQDKILFLGTMLPDVQLLDRLLQTISDDVKTNTADHITPKIQNSALDIIKKWNLRSEILRQK